MEDSHSIIGARCSLTPALGLYFRYLFKILFGFSVSRSGQVSFFLPKIQRAACVGAILGCRRLRGTSNAPPIFSSGVAATASGPAPLALSRVRLGLTAALSIFQQILSCGYNGPIYFLKSCGAAA